MTEIKELKEEILKYMGDTNQPTTTITELEVFFNKSTPPDQVGITREQVTKAMRELLLKGEIKKSVRQSPETKKWANHYWIARKEEKNPWPMATTMICPHCLKPILLEGKLDEKTNCF